MNLKWPCILILSSFSCKITLLIYAYLVLLVIDRYKYVWTQLRCAWEREELLKAISSRGWRHQQLIYLPHVINCTPCMRSSPHLTSPHLTSPHLTSPHLTSPHLTRTLTLTLTSSHSIHPSSPLLCSFKIWYFCSANSIYCIGRVAKWTKRTDVEADEGNRGTPERDWIIRAGYVASVTASSRLKVLRGDTYLRDDIIGDEYRRIKENYKKYDKEG